MPDELRAHKPTYEKRILPGIDCTPIEQAIQEHITMYNVSLPEHIVALSHLCFASMMNFRMNRMTTCWR
jgi:hypothetical protein